MRYRELWRQCFPVRLEAIARLFERCRRPGAMLARMKAGIEAAGLLPLIAIDRDAGAFADRTNTDVIIKDVSCD
jgi:hypothetical protein